MDDQALCRILDRRNDRLGYIIDTLLTMACILLIANRIKQL
jgi:hypothetical protein